MIHAAISVQYVTSTIMLIAGTTAVFIGARPFLAMLRRHEEQTASVLQGTLLLDIPARVATVLAAVVVVMVAAGAYGISGSLFFAFIAAVLASFLPSAAMKMLKARRLKLLENQLVPGVQTLASGVRAGLNLVQSMALVARDGPIQLRQEFAQMLREYDYGMPLDEAMDNSATRIGSGNFRLLFAALQTHRERGGDLGETLDRIADSIREIQRLENRVDTLTAQGRANARMLGMLVALSVGILYLIDPKGVMTLVEEGVGKVILGVIVLLNVIGFVWIKKIVSIDI